MTRAKKILRRIRTIFWTALTLVILLAAVMVGVGKLLMPYSVQYQPQLEAWLSREFQQPVVVDSFTGEWKAFGPRISLEGVTLMGDGQGDGEIAIQHAALDIKPLNALLPNRPLYSFRIIGADLSLVRSPDGRFELSGLGVSGRNNRDRDPSGLRSLTSVGEIRLEGSSLSFDDEEGDIHIQLTGMRGRLQLNGRELSTELEANISDENKTRVLGDLKATLLITLSEEQRLSKAQWHVKTGELMIAELARQLPFHALIPRSGWLNAEIWGDWSQDSAQLMEGVIDLRESTLSERPRLLQLDHLNTRFRWNFHERKVWRIDLSDFTIEKDGESWRTEKMSIERNIPGNLGMWVSSDFLDIEFPLELTQRVMSSYNSRWPRVMPKQARGTLHGFDLVLDSRWKLFMVNGAMDTVDAWEWDRYPDVAGVSGSLALLGGEGEVNFSGQDVRLDWPKNFRRQAVVDIPACSMEILWGEPGAWRMDAKDCVVENDLFSISGRARFAGNEGKPVMDINMRIHRADLPELDDYWPQSLLSPNVVNWLRRGIDSGQASNGRFTMRGDMDDWPFRGQEGLLLASADIGNAGLDYYPGWPRARNIDLSAEFRNTRMDAQGTIGDMAGVTVQKVSAHVSDFKLPVLELDYHSTAPMPGLVNFIERTPLLDDVDLDLDQFNFEHQATTSGRISAPLRTGLGELTVDGLLSLDGNRFTETNSGIELINIKGQITYDREGLHGESLTTTFRDQEANLTLNADWDGDEVFSATQSGVFRVSDLLPDALLRTEPMLHKFEGSSRFDIRFSVKKDERGGPHETWVDIRSDLAGVTLDFPVPLKKSAETTWPLEVHYPIKAKSPVMFIRLNDQASLQFEQGPQLGAPQRANIHFGTGRGELPDEGFFSLDGRVSEFDLDAWMDLVIERFNEEREGQGLVFDKARLFTNDLRFLNRSFSDAELAVQYENEVLAGEIDSNGLAGTIRYSRSDDGSHSLAADLDRMFLPEPIDEGMTMDTDPSQLPELHLLARQFSYAGLRLGETRIEAFPIQNGLRIASVESVSPELNFQARGDWIRDAQGSRSDFDIVMTSESLGSLMEMMEISSVLEGGQTMLRYDAWWPGPPAAFALAQLNGEMSINVSNGRILNADAGAGRIVGLLSVAALPRRLALDFRDVFGSGFNFDQAAGTVTLESGSAYTEDLVLESTAATMAITGTSDLEAKEFDYIMAVRPGVSQTLPALGAVIGGPGGAAAGLALAGLLRKSLGDATEALYTIRGPWSSPTVEPVNSPATTVDSAAEPEEESATPQDGTGNE